jgi:hypothetical protein
MAIWAQQREIVRSVIFPIAIEMLDFNRDAICYRMPLRPSTARALLAKLPNEIASDEAMKVLFGRISSCFTCSREILLDLYFQYEFQRSRYLRAP